jgi:hypothetical protein
VTTVPRCSHGNIILGCPEDVCPEQDEYVGRVADQYAEWYRNNTLPARFPMDSDDETGRTTT